MFRVRKDGDVVWRKRFRVEVDVKGVGRRLREGDVVLGSRRLVGVRL